MITALLNRPLETPTEGASSRMSALHEYLASRDPGFRTIVARPHPPGGAPRPLALAAGLAGAVRVALGALASRNRLILLSAPHLPFFDTPSRVDLTLASTALALLRAGRRATRAVVVLNLHDVRSLQLEDFGVDVPPRVLELFRKLERRSFAASDYVLAPGGGWPDLLEERFAVARSRLVDFPNGCVSPREGLEAPAGLPSGLRFAYAGTLSPPARGLEQMVREFRRVERRDVSLLLLGPGGEWTEPYVREDSRIHWLGALPVHDCMAVLKECHAAIYPYPDTFYFAITHTTSKMALYMTCGLPVLARDSAAVTRFVEGERVGVAYEPGRLAELVAELAGQPERLAALRERAERLAPSFSWARIIDAAFARIAERERLELPWDARGTT